MKEEHILIILRYIIGFCLGFLSYHYLFAYNKEQEKVESKWRCIEYIGSKANENCVLIRKEKL